MGDDKDLDPDLGKKVVNRMRRFSTFSRFKQLSLEVLILTPTPYPLTPNP